MGTATHLGPWLLGTVKDTTGTTAGTIANVGVTSVMQTKAVAYADTTAQTRAFVIPAGSLIDSISFIITTAYTTTAPTFTIFVNGTAITTATLLAGLSGTQAIALGTANPSLVANVGTSDAVIAFTQANGGGGTGAGTLVIHYAVRNPNGTYTATP